MTIQHTKTGKTREVTADAWARIKAGQFGHVWALVSAPEKPKEVKNVRAKQKPESDNNGLETTPDLVPGGDAGNDE